MVKLGLRNIEHLLQVGFQPLNIFYKSLKKYKLVIPLKCEGYFYTYHWFIFSFKGHSCIITFFYQLVICILFYRKLCRHYFYGISYSRNLFCFIEYIGFIILWYYCTDFFNILYENLDVIVLYIYSVRELF